MISEILNPISSIISPLISAYVIQSYISSLSNLFWSYGWAGVITILALLWAVFLPYKNQALIVALTCASFAAGGLQGTHFEHERMKVQEQALRNELDKVRDLAITDIKRANPNSVRNDPYNRDK